MFKKKLALLLAALTLAGLLSGCSREKKDAEDELFVCYHNVYAGTWEDWLVCRPAMVEDPDAPPEELLPRLVERMKTPDSAMLGALVPPELELERAELEEGRLELCFSGKIRRMSLESRQKLMAGLCRMAGQFDGVEQVELQDPQGSLFMKMPVDGILTDPQALGARAVAVEFYLNPTGSDRLDRVTRTVYTSQEALTLDQTIRLLLTMQRSGALSIPFDGMIEDFTVEITGGICRLNLVTEEQPEEGVINNFDHLDIYGLVNSLWHVEGATKFLVTINGQPPSALDIEGCDDILYFNGDYINQ